MEHGATGSRWAIATPHRLATGAGAEAFERGGNAIDAALSAAVTLAVCYPHMCGAGGDLFALVHRAQGDVLVVNSSGRAPAGVDPEAVRSAHGDSMPIRGPVPVTVPGAVAGWEALHRIGATLPWADLFAEPTRLASEGTPMPESLHEYLRDEAALFSEDAGMAGVFYPSGSPVPPGDTFRNPALAATLERIAAGGAAALYGGPLGKAFAEGLRAAGSPITAEDMAAHRAGIVPPLSGRFRDLHVSVAPPNSQGYSLLQILAAIDRLELDPDPIGPDAGTLARIFLTAMRDVLRHLADPERMKVHPSTLLDDGHIAAFCDEVRSGDGSPATTGSPDGDTIALVCVDAAGNAVSLIQSLFWGFGSGILEPETGIVAHNRGACFSLELGHPNELAPEALPLHTLLPVLLHDEHGRLAGAVGTMGGFQQAQLDAQAIARTFVLGLAPEQAVGAPRWVVLDPPDAPRAELEEGAGVEALIEEAGFDTSQVPNGQGTGHTHLIRVTSARLLAGSDPRSDGGALAG
jgi:gamma-glutamyltranspeptidase/glutathione hydrolase